MQAYYFALIDLNLRLQLCSKASFSLLLILLCTDGGTGEKSEAINKSNCNPERIAVITPQVAVNHPQQTLLLDKTFYEEVSQFNLDRVFVGERKNFTILLQY